MYRRNSEGSLFGLIGGLYVFLIAVLVKFVFDYYLYIILGSILLIVLFFVWKYIKHLKFKKLEREYKSTIFYKKTGLPYRKYIGSRQYRFEREIYHMLNKKLGSDVTVIHGLQIYSSETNYTQERIDMMLLHKSGVYVLEIRPTRGYVTGERDGNVWHTAYGVYQEHKKQETYPNQIKHNETNIEALNKIVELPYKNRVIYSADCDVRVEAEEIMNIRELIDEIRYADFYEDLYKLKDIIQPVLDSAVSYSKPATDYIRPKQKY